MLVILVYYLWHMVLPARLSEAQLEEHTAPLGKTGVRKILADSCQQQFVLVAQIPGEYHWSQLQLNSILSYNHCH